MLRAQVEFVRFSSACRFGFSARGGSQQHGSSGGVPAPGARGPPKQPGLSRPPLVMQGNPQIQLSQSQNTFSQFSQNDEQYQLMIVKSQEESRPQEEVSDYLKKFMTTICSLFCNFSSWRNRRLDISGYSNELILEAIILHRRVSKENSRSPSLLQWRNSSQVLRDAPTRRPPSPYSSAYASLPPVFNRSAADTRPLTAPSAAASLLQSGLQKANEYRGE